MSPRDCEASPLEGAKRQAVITPTVFDLRRMSIESHPMALYMAIPDLLWRVALALGIGLLIGLERGWRTREAELGSRVAGIRTFAISGLLGSIAGAIATTS